MSTEAFNAFRARIATDKMLEEACRKAYASGKREEVEQLVPLAKSHGFDFTVAEAEAALADGELSDLELELVAAGTPVGCTDTSGVRV
jgi:predicted ribosomally synthesized peptide with nif11-like leader